jgi:hypothetical protein
MQCKQCGTEIADTALICYRCGAATAARRVRPPAARSGRASPVPAALALTVLIISALFMGRALTGDVPRVLSWLVAALAAVVLVWRLLLRRRSS